MGHIEEFLRDYLSNAPSFEDALGEIQDAVDAVTADREDGE